MKHVSAISVWRWPELVLVGLLWIGVSHVHSSESTSLTHSLNDSASKSLEYYRANLKAFRGEFGGGRDLPFVPFFQFGMGLRTKYLYKDGRLVNALTGALVRSWDATNAVILPPEYCVLLTMRDGSTASITEDERGVWVRNAQGQEMLQGTGPHVRLPDFAGYRYGSILRVLHHEILINVTPSGPVPNFYVYSKPWYRDGAMMAMSLKRTDNLDLIRDWILGLKEPYDHNNAGETEPDNLGQALFLISCVANKLHPLVSRVLQEAKRFEVHDSAGNLYIKGRSDFAERPIYQTKWLKYGLRALGLRDPYSIPKVPDSYSSLFWMDYRESHVSGKEADDRGLYPYLGWATDHFRGSKLSPISVHDYPLTWEIRASQASYDGMKIIDPVFVEQKTATPHTWHAAEIFLYLLDATATNNRNQPATKKP